MVPQSVVARLSLVMGLPVLGAGNSFLAKMLTALEGRPGSSHPRKRNTYAGRRHYLGRALLELAANDFTGTLHLAGNTRLNRYDMACRIAERLGYSPSLDRCD